MYGKSETTQNATESFYTKIENFLSLLKACVDTGHCTLKAIITVSDNWVSASCFHSNKPM